MCFCLARVIVIVTRDYLKSTLSPTGSALALRSRENVKSMINW